jgi:hypothetical protein
MLKFFQKKRREDKIEIAKMEQMAESYIKTLDMRMKELKEEQTTKRNAQRNLRIEKEIGKDMHREHV